MLSQDILQKGQEEQARQSMTQSRHMLSCASSSQSENLGLTLMIGNWM